MEPLYAGWLSIIPPILAIALALITKEVISSLLIGILSGALIYSIGMNLNPIVGTLDTTFSSIIKSANLNIIIFICLLGALIHIITIAGGSKAYGKWASTKIKSRKSSLIATALLGVFIFIDDYFNCLTVGTVMRPVTDKYNVPRAKLAYIIDCIAAPICIMAPISSWAAAISSNIESTGYFKNGLEVFLSAIPLNLYSILSILMVFIIVTTGLDYGSMYKYEQNYKLNSKNKNDNKDVKKTDDCSDNGTVWDMAVPIISLIVFSILGMLYTGGFFSQGENYMNLGTAFANCDTSKSLVWGSFGALIVSFLMFVPRKLMSFEKFMNGVYEGFKTMIPACCILFLAWTIGFICRDILQTPVFISNFINQANIPIFLLPALIFVIAAFLSFSTGTAWGTFSILIPIIVSVASAISPDLLIVSLSATLAGSVFGDNCSPISDTTILSSAGAGCTHIDHVTTQLPYAMTVAFCCVIGYIVAGLTKSNILLTLGASVGSLIISIIVCNKVYKNKRKL